MTDPSNPTDATDATDSANALAAGIGAVLAGRRVILCCGPGGVGKTTTAAAIAVGLARSGRRCAIVTIDPAKRLANALGLASLANRPTRVPLEALRSAAGTLAGDLGTSPTSGTAGTPGPPGELWALMLDTRATFDDLIREHAPSPGQAERILANVFYRNIAGSLSGTQEYMATEKLYELVHAPVDQGGVAIPPFDCIVVDTPPTRNALEFLTAPERLTRFLDNRVFRALTAPARGGLRVVGMAAQGVLRSIGKVVGGAVIADAVGFFQAFDGMEEGFRRRAQSVLAMLRDDRTAWVLVTTARQESITEARFFAAALTAESLTVSAVIANRVQPRFDPLPAEDPSSPHAAALAYAHAARTLAVAHDTALAPLFATFPQAAHLRVALQPNDVHDIAGLDAIAGALWDGGSVRVAARR